MRIMITGCNGVVGTELMAQLQAVGHEVCGVDLAHNEYSVPFHPNLYGSGNYVRADVADARQLHRAIAMFQPTLIYHAAAEFGRWNGQDYYEQLWKSNCIGTRNMLELQQQFGFRCVYFSSSEVYGDSQSVMDEPSAMGCEQMNDYAISKWANELQVRSTPGVEGLAYIVRLFNTYGPGEYYTPYRSVACRFIYRLLHGQPIRVSRGHSRAHTWLPDCCRALTNFCDSDALRHTEYNIGTTNSHTIEQLAEFCVQYTGANPDLVQIVDGEAMTTRMKKVDNARAVQDLAFQESTPLERGVQETVDWMRQVYDV